MPIYDEDEISSVIILLPPIHLKTIQNRIFLVIWHHQIFYTMEVILPTDDPAPPTCGTLPLELLEHVVFHLSSDIETLKTLRLASRVFHNSANSSLFYNLRIFPVRQRDIDRLVNIAQSPDLAPKVRELEWGESCWVFPVNMRRAADGLEVLRPILTDLSQLKYVCKLKNLRILHHTFQVVNGSFNIHLDRWKILTGATAHRFLDHLLPMVIRSQCTITKLTLSWYEVPTRFPGSLAINHVLSSIFQSPSFVSSPR